MCSDIKKKSLIDAAPRIGEVRRSPPDPQRFTCEGLDFQARHRLCILIKCIVPGIRDVWNRNANVNVRFVLLCYLAAECALTDTDSSENMDSTCAVSASGNTQRTSAS